MRVTEGMGYQNLLRDIARVQERQFAPERCASCSLRTDFRVAVNGGTGPFKGAEGQVTIHSLNSDGSVSRDVIELIG